jgi:hypothetical protein
VIIAVVAAVIALVLIAVAVIALVIALVVIAVVVIAAVIAALAMITVVLIAVTMIAPLLPLSHCRSSRQPGRGQPDACREHHAAPSHRIPSLREGSIVNVAEARDVTPAVP